MRRIALLLALLLCATSLTSLTAQGSNRIIAIGDIHGSLDGFTAILKKTGLIDDKQSGPAAARSCCRPATTPIAAKARAR